MFRFSHSEETFLRELHGIALQRLGDHTDVQSYTQNRIPAGGVDEPPLLENLLSALSLRGDFQPYRNILETRGGVLEDTGIGICPSGEVTICAHGGGPLKSIQSDAYTLFSKLECSFDFSASLIQKICITLGETLSCQLRAEPDWYPKLLKVLPRTKQQASVALFKTFIGGWTTTHRMHEPSKLKCLFGCFDATDDLPHYLFCTPLWMIAAGAVGAPPPLLRSKSVCA